MILKGNLSCLILISLGALTSAPAVAQPDGIGLGKPDRAGFVKFRGAAFPVSEEAGEVIVVVKRQAGSSSLVTVEYSTSAGSATDGLDYEDISGILVWEDGDRGDKSFAVQILDDDENEGLETFGLLLSNPTGGVEIGNPGVARVHIRPSDRRDGDDCDDGGAGVLSFTTGTFTTVESSVEVLVTVKRTEGSDGVVMVDYATADGSALAGEDYEDTPGFLTWADGECGIQSFVVPLIDDDEAENLESFTASLTAPTGGAVLGVPDVASIVIVDDDGAEGNCLPDDETLCLRSGRFEVVGTWENFDGSVGPFNVIPVSDDSGLISFVDPSNFDMLVKVLDGCADNDHYWVSFATASNLGFLMEVTDLDAVLTRVYENPLGTVPPATTDMTAFETCS